MSAAPDPAPRAKSPVWLKALLIVSLVANVAIVGLYAGALMKEKKRDRGATRQIEWILSFLPDERRADAETLFTGRRDELRRLYRDSVDDMAAIVSAIRADPYSPETLDSALTARRASSLRRREIVQEGLLELMSTLTPAERQHFADALEEKLQTWKKNRREVD